MGPLTGVRVVEIASLAPAPFGCMILADLGAEVLRVDRLGSTAGISMPSGPLDRGRRTVAVNLKTAAGVDAVRKLALRADVFVEGFRPGVMERLGLGPGELTTSNRRLIYARMTGWGQVGPLNQRAGHDINYLALSGALQPIARHGERPLPPLNMLADFAGGGMVMALGILAALNERASSGEGQVIDAAMVDGASLYTAFMRGLHADGQWTEEPGTNMLDGGAPFYDTYACADGGYVAVGCVEPQFFAEFVRVLQLDTSDLLTQYDSRGWDAWRTLIADVFSTKTRDEWAEVFIDTDACVTPVLAPWECHRHPHHVARDAFTDVNGIIQPSPAPRFSRTPAPSPSPPDRQGRDVRRTLSEWGISSQESALLIESGAIA